jgi:hypothetical protein
MHSLVRNDPGNESAAEQRARDGDWPPQGHLGE